MACTCVQCTECKGKGYGWLSFDGQKWSPFKRDDLSEMEECLVCDGTGITSYCRECQESFIESRRLQNNLEGGKGEKS